MSEFESLNLDSAPDGSKPMLETANKRFGFIPEIYAKMAYAPAVIEGYITLAGCFEKSSFSPQQQQLILLVISIENRCEYCVAAHSMIAKDMVKLDTAVVDAVRSAEPIADPKLQALAQFTRTIVRERGFAPKAAIDAFLAAGFEQPQILEVILGVAVKTLSNYSNHLTDPQPDAAFEPHRWQAPAKPM